MKMVHIGLMIRLQRFIKVFRYVTATGRKNLKRILTYLCCTKYSEINIRHLDVQNFASCRKGINSINILYTGSHKSLPKKYGL